MGGIYNFLRDCPALNVNSKSKLTLKKEVIQSGHVKRKAKQKNPAFTIFKDILSFCSVVNCRGICVQMTTKRWLASRQRRQGSRVTRALRLHT